MSQEKNLGIAQQLLTGIGEGKDPNVIAALFSENVVFEIPGDDGVLPWIGRKTGRGAVTDFIRGLRSMTEPIKFDLQDVLANDARAVIVGELVTRIKATGSVIESAIAIILTVSDGEVTRFQMLEDSFAVSRAARAQR
jgi:ketosteroid isomerase-like protein